MRPRHLASTFALLVVLAWVSAARGQGRAPVVQLKYLGTAGWEISDGATVMAGTFLSQVPVAIVEKLHSSRFAAARRRSSPP